jgi:thiaminase
MRSITTSTGAPIALDGDLLAILETLYREITVKKHFDRSFEDMIQEIRRLIDQMSDEERRAYLVESLFLNSVKYENDRAEALMRKLSGKK